MYDFVQNLLIYNYLFGLEGALQNILLSLFYTRNSDNWFTCNLLYIY